MLLLAAVIIAALLCPLWWTVGQRADAYRSIHDECASALAGAVYRAASATAFIAGIVAIGGALWLLRFGLN